METKNVVVLAVIGITLQKRTNNNKYKQIIKPPWYPPPQHRRYLHYLLKLL